VNIRRVTNKDIPLILKWFDDEEINYFIQSPQFTYSAKELEKRNEDITKRLFFIIETKKGIPIGFILLSNIQWEHRNSEVGVAICEKKYRNLFFGVDTFITFFDYIFNTLNLHKIYGIIVEYNDVHIRLAERGGLKREGVLREHYFRDGKYYNGYFYGMVKKDYLEVKEEIDKYYAENIHVIRKQK